MLISKKLIPSFSLVDDENIDELKWLIEAIKEAMQKTYRRKTVVFEHGMCACVGGLDRAHIHLMTIDESTSDDLIKDSINKNRVYIDSYELGRGQSCINNKTDHALISEIIGNHFKQ